MKIHRPAPLKIIVSLIVPLALSGCISLPSSFKTEDRQIVHTPTGVGLPKKIKGWNLMEGTTEKVDENIAALVPYQIYSFKKGSADGRQIPTAKVYILTSANAEGAALVKERVQKDLPELKEVRKEEIATSKGAASATVYRYTVIVDPLPLLKVTTSKIENESWLVTPLHNKQTVYWITFDVKQKDADKSPADFVKNFAEAL